LKESDPDLRIRLASRADVSAMLELEGMSSTAGHWSRQQYEDLFAANHLPGAEPYALVGEEEVQQQSTPLAQPRIVGFLIARRIDTEWELENIVVAETARRSGAGSQLLHDLVATARAKNGDAIFLEVRESNHAARSFYQRAGFCEAGLRKGYYAGPREDAVVYRLNLR
jgi:[ribosomal protein S18]-alanine N-acetyltransferase